MVSRQQIEFVNQLFDLNIYIQRKRIGCGIKHITLIQVFLPNRLEYRNGFIISKTGRCQEFILMKDYCMKCATLQCMWLIVLCNSDQVLSAYIRGKLPTLHKAMDHASALLASRA